MHSIASLYFPNLSLTKLGDYTQAISYYDKALAIDPNNVYALSGKGVALDSLGNHTQDITYYDTKYI